MYWQSFDREPPESLGFTNEDVEAYEAPRLNEDLLLDSASIGAVFTASFGPEVAYLRRSAIQKLIDFITGRTHDTAD